jgi:anaerobic ribonucleoside-triphosphate reductase activating protein
LLDGVVFCGGEPTVDRHLGSAIDQVRQRGFKIGLHTAGIYPDRLRKLLPKIDWVGFDVKAPFDDYTNTTGVHGSGERAKESLDHLLASGVAHEVRTTRHPALLSSGNLKSMATSLRELGVEKFALQEFRPDGCADELLDAFPPPLADDDAGHLKQLFPTFILRRAS